MQSPAQREDALGEARDAAALALLRRIEENAETGSPARLLELAEAYAWVKRPGQPHGSNVTQTSTGRGS